jgi:hypothetical protein
MGRNGGTIGAASRIPGIDLARFLAIAGMLAVHVGPMGLTDPMGRLYALLTHGRASILFGLLAGIGVSLLAQSRSASLGETRLRLVWQAALLLPLGLWLQTLDVPIRVILSYYALLFLLGAACIGLATRPLATLAAAALALGPVAFQLDHGHQPDQRRLVEKRNLLLPRRRDLSATATATESAISPA